jgi:hypothetical protein
MRSGFSRDRAHEIRWANACLAACPNKDPRGIIAASREPRTPRHVTRRSRSRSDARVSSSRDVADLRFRLAAFAPSLPSAVLVRLSP